MRAKRKRTPDERAEDDARGEWAARLLRERIDYHRRKLLEEGRTPQTLEQRIAYHRARRAAERDERAG
jgi:hypothetical protein